MMKKTKIIVASCAALIVLYVAGPIIAGATCAGDREGPILYPEEFHTALYIIGYESAFQEKPRQRWDCWMYRRPLFYGMPRRLKSEAERHAYIDMARRNQSPRINDLIEMNERANKALEAIGDPGSPQPHR